MVECPICLDTGVKPCSECNVNNANPNQCHLELCICGCAKGFLSMKDLHVSQLDG